MFCGKCGTKLDDNVKFCGKCGTKIENKPINTGSEASDYKGSKLNSFGGNIVKNDTKSDDQDIFSTIEIGAAEGVKKGKGKFKIKEKIKIKLFKDGSKKTRRKKTPVEKKSAKSESKRTKKTEKIKKAKKTEKVKKERKPLKLKIILPIVIGILLLIAGCAAFIFIKFGDNLFANKYVSSSVLNTFKQYDNSNRKLDVMPDLILAYDEEDALSEREMYFKLQNSHGGFINENVLGSLEGLSLQINEKHDTENDIYNTKIGLINLNNDEMYGEISSSPTVAVVNIPGLYEKSLGINIGNDEEIIYNSQACRDIADTVGIVSQFETAFSMGKKSLETQAKGLLEEILVSSEFEIESKDKETNERIYTAVLDKASMLNSIKTFLNSMKSDSNIRSLVAYYIHFMEDRPFRAVDTAIDDKFDKLIMSAESALNSERVENVELRMVINKDKIIKALNFTTVIDGIGVDVDADLVNNENSFDLSTVVRLTNQDSYIDFKILSTLAETDETALSANRSIELVTSFGDTISVALCENYNKNTSYYNCNVKFTIDTLFEGSNIEIDLSGNQENIEKAEKLNIDSMKLSVNNELYKLFFDFNGYITKQAIDTIEPPQLSNVVFIDNNTDDEMEKIKIEIYKKGMEFLELFGKGEW